MSQSVLFACLPWAAILVAAVITARILVWFSDARLSLSRLCSIHRCQRGSVQSLSFVLTLPFFVMIIMLIVQVSHIMFANILIQYSAYAAARSAIVWIPANATADESANRIASFDHPVYNLTDTRHHHEFTSYDGPKMSKIKTAAMMALMPLGPSRDLGYSLDADGESLYLAQSQIYQTLDTDSLNNSRIDARLRNKLAYTAANTEIEMDFWHKVEFLVGDDAPLIASYPFPNTVGWQDHLTVRVDYNLPLLPGPIRLFSRRARTENGSRTDASGQVYVWHLEAQATLGNEGELPLLSYWQEEILPTSGGGGFDEGGVAGAGGGGPGGVFRGGQSR